MSQKYYFKFNADCFDLDQHRSDLSRTIHRYTPTVYNMNREVEELDRYDDFDALKISDDKYERPPGKDYGIPYDPGKHLDRSVIFRHQHTAAVSFLKDLRGFGLLADVVGSGKTFEAGIILSELAVRGKIRSMLIVVPDQVYDSWIDVLEKQFGLGEGVLFEAGSQCRSQFDLANAHITFDVQNRPDRPIIVKMDDFISWQDSMTKCLFDVVVVDEAHHLCDTDGKYARAMQLLSKLMQTKKLANITYCLLLSATPHSGNLAHMFRLWYFIRTKGGIPSDFEEKEDQKYSEAYKKEKRHYTEVVCRGATTVMEFIKRVKKDDLLRSYPEQFEKHLLSQRMSRSEFDKMTEGEQQAWIDEFLGLDVNEEINVKIMQKVARAYHNGVLRAIMIRQSSTELVKKKKSLVNYLYYPALRRETVRIKTDNGRDLDVDMQGNAVFVTPVDEDGTAEARVPLTEYVSSVSEGHVRKQRLYFDLIGKIFAATADPAQFTKQNFMKYYKIQFSNCFDKDIHCELRPIFEDVDLFRAKFEDAKNILRKHRDSKVLVFFDYELKKRELLFDSFLRELKKFPELASRIVVGASSNEKETQKISKEFEEKENAILVAKEASFTEGANFQSGNVIINFQVTPDPLAMDQRIGRIFRLGQKNDVIIYSLAAMNRLEGFALMYFARIGLMSSNSGDATIISGSNNERMVAIRCDRCGKVKLFSQEDYEHHKKHSPFNLYCSETLECRDHDRPQQGTLMKEISVYDFKCDHCSAEFIRSVSDENGYRCVSQSNTDKGIMCNQGEQGDRRVYCRKICAMSHCNLLLERKCPAVAAYQKNRNIGEQDLYAICEACPKARLCGPDCRVGTGPEAIKQCSSCMESACTPAPHVISFNDHWEAKCPACGVGHLRPVVARTFAAYLRASWDFKHDNGRAFCDNLLKEAAKVADIKLILDDDKDE